MTIVGYARVSTRDQDPAAQQRELTAAGAVRVFVDHGESSRLRDRPQWLACLDYLRPGDTLTVAELYRLCRDLADILTVRAWCQDHQVSI